MCVRMRILVAVAPIMYRETLTHVCTDARREHETVILPETEPLHPLLKLTGASWHS